MKIEQSEISLSSLHKKINISFFRQGEISIIQEKIKFSANGKVTTKDEDEKIQHLLS